MKLRVVLTVAAVALVGGATAFGASRVFIPASTMASYEPFNIFLTYRTPDASVISRQRAINVATGHQSKYWTVPMRVDARYGLFSDNTTCTQRNARSKCVLDYQKVPAWVVTLTGADACFSLGGALGVRPTPTTSAAQAAEAQATSTAQKAQCQEHYVVNAKTGRQILTFN
ncbi:MAG TPA: hypothetical protein VG815_18555 [Chloroflexota bacterium]|nr:hypothetical protein [Chloroflexota bacterium]